MLPDRPCPTQACPGPRHPPGLYAFETHAVLAVTEGVADLRVLLEYQHPQFLDLLREAGIRGRGIDIDPERVALCRAKGHDAEVADAVDHLEGLEADSVPALFAAQVIEHLAWPDLNRLFQLAADRMAPGGVAIFETVNPHSASALKAFWTDPTHQHPLFP